MLYLSGEEEKNQQCYFCFAFFAQASNLHFISSSFIEEWPVVCFCLVA
jgi:hypothetical protein